MPKIKTHPQQYKYFYFLTALSITILLASAVLGNKLIETSFGILSAASLISPFWYALGDIITEVYGIKNVMKLFWSAIICQFIFALICLFLMKLKSPLSFEGQVGYNLALGQLLRFAIFQFVGITIAWHINATLLNKWRILTSGKYFWLRSIGSSGIGLVIFSVIAIFPSVIGIFPLKTAMSIVIFSCLLKIILTILLALPSSIFVFLLRKNESLSEYTHNFQFNPFQHKSEEQS